MSNRELDRILRERLEHFEMEPPMHLWEQIAAARAGARRPLRPWLWWSGGFGVLALSAGLALWLLFGQTSWTSQPVAQAVEQPAVKAGVSHIQAVEQPASLPIAEISPEKPSVPSSPAPVVVAEKMEEETVPPPAAPVLAVAADRSETTELAAGTDRIEGVDDLDGLDGLTTGLWNIDWKYRPKDGFPVQSCPAFSKEKWHLNWNVEVVGSPEFVVRSLHAKTPEFSDYASNRNQMEEIRGGFAAGVRVSAVTDFGVSLRTGIQYGQINEVFNYRDGNDIRIIVTNVYDGQGNIIGTDTIFEAGTHIKVTYNRHRMIDIPVMAGYEFQFPRFSMAVHGGACFNLLFNQKGDILGPDETPVVISSGDANAYPAFRDRLGVSLLGSIGFNYRLTPELQFIVEPQFRVILDPVTRPGYPLSQEYFMTGITLGVRQRL
ncbi:MAG: hypothetical protein H6563_04250 [Lewinellaceae bacterium]|nr:hypothetical protein [Lewinellaceae bacterium]